MKRIIVIEFTASIFLTSPEALTKFSRNTFLYEIEILSSFLRLNMRSFNEEVKNEKIQNIYQPQKLFECDRNFK
jgi:hypothetical protein